MSSILDATEISFSWGDNHVLKGLDLEIGENELVSILGVNGAGKSTLLKCLNRILTPQSGKIQVSSKDVGDLTLLELSKLMSYVPQSVRSSFSMDVFDVVLLGRRPHISWRISDDDRDKVSETLRILNLEDFAFRRFDQLSGGERQRVIIAKAVAQDPKIFLLDEPTSDLDLKNQIEIMKSLRKLISDPESPKSALIAIHDINIAARFSDRILLLHDGKIISQGTPEEVLNPYNIAKVFGVTSKVEVYSPSVRVIIEDEISDDNSEPEESRDKFNHGKSGKSKSKKIEQ